MECFKFPVLLGLETRGVKSTWKKIISESDCDWKSIGLLDFFELTNLFLLQDLKWSSQEHWLIKTYWNEEDQSYWGISHSLLLFKSEQDTWGHFIKLDKKQQRCCCIIHPPYKNKKVDRVRTTEFNLLRPANQIRVLDQLNFSLGVEYSRTNSRIG